MERVGYPITPAVRLLKEQKIEFHPHLYRYVDKGGTAHSAAELKVSEHSVIKTLIFETEKRDPLVVLMHGDREVSTKTLARVIGAKNISPCDPVVAHRHSGYQIGGTSPLGMRKALPVYAERTIFDLDVIYINGGKRGFLVSLRPARLKSLLAITEVDVAIRSR